jgi:asparagine synthase (glutamine-hydrolysing)
VVLSGDGGDELFWGYGAYRWAKRLKHPMLRAFRSPIAHILSLGSSRYKRVSHLFNFETVEFLPFHIFSQEQYYFSQREVQSILNSDFVHSLEFKSFENVQNINEVELQSLSDFVYYLKDDLMVKVDRASMRYSLEVRSPLLDYRIVEFAYNLAPQLKHNHKTDKYLLKQILYEYIPAEYFNRPKWGFSVPLNRWLKHELNAWMKQLLSKDALQKYPFLESDKVEKYVKQFEAGDDYLYGRIWNLMVLISWFERNRIS